MSEQHHGRNWKKIVAILLIIAIGVPSVLYLLKMRGYETIEVNGTTRQYQIFIPSGYNPDHPSPLLLGLHGAGGDAGQFRRSSGFDAVAEAQNFIVVYPDGMGTLKYAFHTWNSGEIPKRTANDVEFLVTLIGYLQAHYRINASQIYMVGHSNGAMMTYRMAGEHADLFAAIATVAGSVGSHEARTTTEYLIPTPIVPLKVIHVHGTDDQMVLFEGGEANEPRDYSICQRRDCNRTVFCIYFGRECFVGEVYRLNPCME